MGCVGYISLDIGLGGYKRDCRREKRPSQGIHHPAVFGCLYWSLVRSISKASEGQRGPAVGGFFFSFCCCPDRIIMMIMLLMMMAMMEIEVAREQD